jgi:curved DNA-binding protein CbpA
VRRVKLGDVEFDVIESENPKDSVTVTDKPVESGQDISDHVKQNSSTINIRGQMTGDGAADKLQTLKRYQKDGELLKYVGRNIYSNMVIEEIDREHGVDNRNGFQFNIKLKQVRIATAKKVKIKVANPKTKKQDKRTATKVKKTTNKGKQQPKTK